MLKGWRVTPDGAFVDGVRISSLTSKDLDLSAHHSIRVRIQVKPDARHPGGVNIFGPRLRQLRSGHRAEAHD
jgi:predicted transcriptional regulator